MSKSHKFGLSTAEKKLLVVFVFYLILGYVDVIGFAVSTSSLDTVAKYIEENLQCEALRVDPDYACPRRFEDIRIAGIFSLLSYILLGLYPIPNLLFAINKSEVQVKLVSWFPSLFTESFQSSTLSTSVKNVQDTPFTMRRRLTYQISTTDHIQRSNEMATIGRSGVYLQKQLSETFKDPTVNV